MVTTAHDKSAALDGEFSHPLRSVPWLRSLPNSAWVDFALTALLSLITAVLLTSLHALFNDDLAFGERLYFNLVYALAIGYCIHLLSDLLKPKIRAWLGSGPFALRLVADVAIWLCGAVIGFWIASAVLDRDPHSTDALLTSLIIALGLASMTGIALRNRALRELEAERQRVEYLEAQRALATTRLRLLQAQIEPHFLFNTLANVSSLIEANPKQARVMLDQFTLLLRALLDQTRQSATTLRKELQVAEAYLSVLKIRMGERLNFQIEVPSDLAETSVPAMLLQPIVENAVKHGIEPLMQGGKVLIAASRDASSLVMEVRDNGVGFTANASESIGLGAIRERLAVQFGADSSLDVSRTPDHWTRVAIRIPMPA